MAIRFIEPNTRVLIDTIEVVNTSDDSNKGWNYAYLTAERLAELAELRNWCITIRLDLNTLNEDAQNDIVKDDLTEVDKWLDKTMWLTGLCENEPFN